MFERRLLLLLITGIRKILLDAYPSDLKRALTAGIGLFIMFIGLKSAGIVVAAPEPILLRLQLVRTRCPVGSGQYSTHRGPACIGGAGSDTNRDLALTFVAFSIPSGSET